MTEALGDTRLTDSTTLYIEGTTSGKLYNRSVTISKAINLQAGRNFTKSSGNINYNSATAIINQITLAANLGNINNVYSNSIFVNGAVASSDSVRGDMLDDALKLITQNNKITLSAGTFQDNSDDFDINTTGVTLEGVGDTTIIDGDNGGNGIQIAGANVTVREVKSYRK